VLYACCKQARRRIVLATTQAALSDEVRGYTGQEGVRPRRRIDGFFVLGLVVALGAIIAGVTAAGISITYFFQPAGALIVIGGTLGVMLVTTPKDSLVHSLRHVMELVSSEEVNREALIEEIILYARMARRSSLLALESVVPKVGHPFLAQALQLALDVSNRAELQTVLENELRMRERQGETDAKTLEVAGGFAPTIGIIGTVVGLIEVLRHFANVQSVGFGIGTAFVSTIYGLGDGESAPSAGRSSHSRTSGGELRNPRTHHRRRALGNRQCAPGADPVAPERVHAAARRADSRRGHSGA